MKFVLWGNSTVRAHTGTRIKCRYATKSLGGDVQGPRCLLDALGGRVSDVRVSVRYTDRNHGMVVVSDLKLHF